MKKMKEIFNYLCKYQPLTGATAMSTLYFINNDNTALAFYGVFLTAALAAKGARRHALDGLTTQAQQLPPRQEHKL